MVLAVLVDIVKVVIEINVVKWVVAGKRIVGDGFLVIEVAMLLVVEIRFWTCVIVEIER